MIPDRSTICGDRGLGVSVERVASDDAGNASRDPFGAVSGGRQIRWEEPAERFIQIDLPQPSGRRACRQVVLVTFWVKKD